MSKITRRAFLKRSGVTTAAFGMGGLLAACGESGSASSGSGGTTASGDSSGPIKVGLLSSLSGVLSITEKSIHDGAALAVDQVNAAGGVNGRKPQPITED